MGPLLGGAQPSRRKASPSPLSLSGLSSLQYSLMPGYYQFLLVSAYLGLIAVESLRLYLGYIGNLQEKVRGAPPSLQEAGRTNWGGEGRSQSRHKVQLHLPVGRGWGVTLHFLTCSHFFHLWPFSSGRTFIYSTSHKALDGVGGCLA